VRGLIFDLWRIFFDFGCFDIILLFLLILYLFELLSLIFLFSSLPLFLVLLSFLLLFSSFPIFSRPDFQLLFDFLSFHQFLMNDMLIFSLLLEDVILNFIRILLFLQFWPVIF